MNSYKFLFLILPYDLTSTTPEPGLTAFNPGVTN